ncbi:hypothetical protein JL722_3807 [Aureococcus anophagefferens]|nr:hypothetical protein JL722_3807 [Aureococcus anophagefferens]
MRSPLGLLAALWLACAAAEEAAPPEAVDEPEAAPGDAEDPPVVEAPTAVESVEEEDEEDFDDIDWGEDSPTGDPTQAKESHDAKEEELWKEPAELVRRANNAFMWGAVNASLEMYGRAVALATNATDAQGREIRRQYATQLAVVMYYKGMTGDGAGLLKSLVSDMDFENVTAIEEEAERVIWLGASRGRDKGASHMKNNNGELVAEEEFELLKSLAIVHLDIFPDWAEGKRCLRAAFKLFMTNNEQALGCAEINHWLGYSSQTSNLSSSALGDLNRCIDSDDEDEQMLANFYLALYADARGKATLSKRYGKAAFRLLPDKGAAFLDLTIMAHAVLREVNKKTDCPCVDDHFYADFKGATCKQHKGYNCDTYAKWPSDYTKADENDVIDHCPKACGLCAAEPPCEFLEASKQDKELRKKRKAEKKAKKAKKKKGGDDL